MAIYRSLEAKIQWLIKNQNIWLKDFTDKSKDFEDISKAIQIAMDHRAFTESFKTFNTPVITLMDIAKKRIADAILSDLGSEVTSNE